MRPPGRASQPDTNNPGANTALARWLGTPHWVSSGVGGEGALRHLLLGCPDYGSPVCSFLG